MGHIYQRGKTWWGYWSDTKGKPHRKSLRTKDAVVARQRLRQHELVSTDPAAYSKHTLGQAIGDLLSVVEHGNAGATWKAYRQKGENLILVLGDVELSTLTRDKLLDYCKARRAEVSDSTIHKELVVLRRALAEAQNRGLWEGDPRALVPTIRVRYKPRERWLTEKQAVSLLATLPAERRLWTGLALNGLCLGEVEGLKVEHVRIKDKAMRVPGTKRESRLRVIPIRKALLPVLTKAIKGRGPDEFVVEHWHNVRRDLRLAIARVNEKACEDAAKKKRRPPEPAPIVSPNDLRRTFASWLKQRKVDSLVVAHLLGHSSTRMVELVYGRLANKNYADAVATLPV